MNKDRLERENRLPVAVEVCPEAAPFIWRLLLPTDRGIERLESPLSIDIFVNFILSFDNKRAAPHILIESCAIEYT